MGSKIIPFLKAQFPNGLGNHVQEVLSSGYVGAGDIVHEFQNEIEKFLGCANVLCTSSCTAALTLAFADAGIKPGVGILTTPMTCAATNIPLLQLGAKIRWIDIDPITGNVTRETFQKAIELNADIKVAVIMDWGGTPCDYMGIEEIAQKFGVTLILDAAQSFGSLYKGSLFGSKAQFVCYSFGPTKILSSVDGGAIIPSRKEHLTRLRKLRWHGIDREARDQVNFWGYEIEEFGYRFTGNNVFAAIGVEMLKLLPVRLAHQRSLAAIYYKELENVPGIVLQPIPFDVSPNFWMMTIIAEDRSVLLSKLHKEGIHAAIPHSRNDRIECFAKRDDKILSDLPGVNSFSEKYLCLPIGSWVSEEEVHYICERIASGW